MDKQKMQDAEYSFPYHWIPHMQRKPGKQASVNVSRELYWGYEYLAYMNYVSDRLIKENFDSILDVGCGDGRLADLYFQAGGKGAYKGIDLSSQAITLARTLNARHGGKAEFCVGSLQAAEENREFECAVLIEVIEHIPDKQLPAFLQSVCSRLKCGGKLYITVPSVHIPLQSKHYRHYTPKLLIEQMEQSVSGMKLVEIRYTLPIKKMQEVYKRVTMNRFFSFHFHALDRKFFIQVRKNIERDNGRCRQVFACFEKVEIAK